MTLSRAVGTIRIGDIEGTLRLDLAGAVDVRSRRVETSSARLCGGGGCVSLASVAGSALDIEVIGTGRVDARGSVEHLLVRVKGSGNVSFWGDAQTADVSVDGAGHVNVMRSAGELLGGTLRDARVAHMPQAWHASDVRQASGRGRA